MASAGAWGQGIGAVTNVYTSYQEGRIARKVGESAATIGGIQAETAESEGRMAMEAAEIEVGKIERAGRKVRGKQISNFAKSGVNPFHGSSADVIAASAGEVGRDIWSARIAGKTERVRALNRAARARTKGEIAKIKGKSIQYQKYIEAAQTTLSSASSMWQQYGSTSGGSTIKMKPGTASVGQGAPNLRTGAYAQRH